MKEAIVNLLKPFAEACHRLAMAIPLDVAAAIYVLVLAMLACWVLTLKREKPSPAGGSHIRDFLRDLKFWAVLILLIQATIYVILR